jgi:hypothetical protein
MLNINSRKTLVLGLSILVLYLTGNGLFHKEEVHSRTSWTNVIDVAPRWLDQAKLKMGTVLNPHIVLNEHSLDPTKRLDAIERKDRYYELATSDGAEKLRSYLQDTYKVSKMEVVGIVSAVFRYGDEHSIAPELVFSVIDSESSFQHNARSGVGALGLMQVLPIWHQDKIRLNGGSNELLWNPEFNIKIGTQILREYINKSSGNVYEALARYNGSFGAKNGYPEKVLRGKERYKQYIHDIKRNS